MKNDYSYYLFDNSRLDLIILPTEKCNFRCSYCYEKFRMGRINSALIDSIKVLLKKRIPRLNHLRIGWFGGEPLLAKDIILDIASFVISESKKHQNLKFDSGMSTNGYLLSPQVMEKLVFNQITEFQITLDGPDYYHDKLRKLKNGGKTFFTILENLVNLKNTSLNFKIHIRIHFSKDNIGLIDELVLLLMESFSNDNRFKIYFKAVAPLGGLDDKHMNFFDYEESREIIKKLQKKYSQLILPEMNDEKPYICYAGRPTSFVIRPNGRILKCTVDLDSDINQIGYLNQNGSLIIDQNKYRHWIKGAVSNDLDFLSCPRSYISNS